MATDYANRPIPPSNSFTSDIPPPTVVIELPSEEEELPSYLPSRVSSFPTRPAISQEPVSDNAPAANAAPGGEDAATRSAIIAQTAIRGYLARKEYKDLHEQNRWRLEAPAAGPRLVSPQKDKVKRKSRPPSRAFHVDSIPQSMPDHPSGTPDEPIDGQQAADSEEKPAKAPRKSYAPGMLAPGMGFGDFDPSAIKLKAAPRPVSMDMKAAAQSPPLKPAPAATLKPVLPTNTAQTKSMPDMPTLPNKPPPPKSPLALDGSEAPPTQHVLAVPSDNSPKRSPAVPKKPGPKMVLPEFWEAHVDVEGRKYYHNTQTEETTWKAPQMVPEHTIVRKIKSPQVQQHHSQNNLFGNLEMLIPQHKFAPQVPKKPPPPPTTGTPPPPEHPPAVGYHAPQSPETPQLIVAPNITNPSNPPASSSASSAAPSASTAPPPSTASSSSSNTTTTTKSNLPPSFSNPEISSSAPAGNLQTSASTGSAAQATPLERTPSEQTRDKRSALRRLLDAFLRRRPPKDELVQKNILPDEHENKKDKKKLEKERKKKEKEDKKKEKAAKK